MQKITFEKRKELDYRMNEAYKSLRTNILFCGDNVKVIALTSCMPNEGKTTVAFELAHSMASNGYQTILIDADLRKSVLVGRYKVGVVKEGLSHYLTGQSPLDHVICETDIENMDIIFSGPYAPNPTEILGGQYFTDMLEPIYRHWEEKLQTMTHLNNPKIPVKYVREHGIKVFPINPHRPIDPDSI